MEKVPKQSKQEAEANYYLSVNKWVNQRLGAIDQNLSARIVSVDQVPRLDQVETFNNQKNVILVNTIANPEWEWTIHIPFDASLLEEYLDEFEKQYRKQVLGQH